MRSTKGSKEEMVADYCASNHRNVILVRNPKFRETNTAYSISIGSIGFHSKVLYLDGDLIISPSSLKNFVERANSTDILVGVTEAKSENAVLARIRDQDANLIIDGFARDIESSYEWANIFAGPPLEKDYVSGYVYQSLERFLPLPACILELHEIDTPSDFQGAKLFMESREKATAQST
jgi:hypothetical protein